MSKNLNTPKSAEDNALKNGQKLIAYDRIENLIRNLTGKVLTIIDSSIANENQNKAMKDLIKNSFSETLYYFQGICFEGKQGHSVNL